MEDQNPDLNNLNNNEPIDLKENQEIKISNDILENIPESEKMPEIKPKYTKKYIPEYLQTINKQTLEYLFLQQKDGLESALKENVAFDSRVLNLENEIRILEEKLQNQEVLEAKNKKLEARVQKLEEENLRLASEQETIEQKCKNEKRTMKKECTDAVKNMEYKLHLIDDKYKEISRFDIYLSELEKNNRELTEKFREMDIICKNTSQQEYEKYQIKLDNIRKKILSTLDLAKVSIMQNSVDKVNNGNKIMMLQNSQLFMELNNQSTLVEKLLLDIRNKDTLIKKLKFDLKIHEDLEKLISTHNLNFKNMLKSLKPTRVTNPVLSELQAFEKQKELLFQNFKEKSNTFFKKPEVQIPDKHIFIPEKEEIDEKKKWKLDKTCRKGPQRISTVKSCTRFSRTNSGCFQIHPPFPLPEHIKKEKDKSLTLSEQIIGCKDNSEKLMNFLLKYQSSFEAVNKILKKKNESKSEDDHLIEVYIQDLLNIMKNTIYEKEEVKIFNLKGINNVQKFNPKKYENILMEDIHKVSRTKLSKFDIRNLI